MRDHAVGAGGRGQHAFVASRDEIGILGISAGASTGAVSVSILGLGAGLATLSSGAFAGALLAFAFVVLLARAAGGGASTQGAGLVILAGTAGSQLFNAQTSYIITRSANAEEVRGIMFWLLGNLSGVRWPDNQAMSCDRVAVLFGGSLVALGAPADILSQALLREVFGVEARFLVDPADGRRVTHFVSRA